MLSDLLDGRAVEDDPVTADGADPRAVHGGEQGVSSIVR